jgi:MoaA/NifB/PqqE/SkfB family radical SAM enzyme
MHPFWRHADYVSLTMEFRCNLACTHCMIEGTMDWLQPQGLAQFEQVLAARERQGWTGLILTGSEITLLKDLPRLAERARAAGFHHVRIQTHGMHLDKPGFLARLVSAGVDEFFVSVAAGRAETHDRITKVPGSFARTLAGLEALEAHDVISLTNTVLTTECYRELPQMVQALGHLRRLRQMEFWNFFPMREADDKGLIVPLAALLPPLRQAAHLAMAAGRRVEIKNVPVCALGEDGGLVANGQPQLFIDPRFWDQFARNGFHQCRHRSVCAAQHCLGLTTAYIASYGPEEALLAPLPPCASPQLQQVSA